jgi:hypothetical protein
MISALGALAWYLQGSPKMVGLFHGKSQFKKRMITGGSPITQESSKWLGQKLFI